MLGGRATDWSAHLSLDDANDSPRAHRYFADPVGSAVAQMADLAVAVDNTPVPQAGNGVVASSMEEELCTDSWIVS